MVWDRGLNSSPKGNSGKELFEHHTPCAGTTQVYFWEPILIRLHAQLFGFPLTHGYSPSWSEGIAGKNKVQPFLWFLTCVERPSSWLSLFHVVLTTSQVQQWNSMLVFSPAALFCHSNSYWLQLVQIGVFFVIIREIIKCAISLFRGSCLKRGFSYQVSLVVF